MLAACSRSANVVEAPMISVDASAALLANEAPPPAASSKLLTMRPGARFDGTYHCSQGNTKLSLVIADVSGHGEDEVDVEATFEFTYDPESSDDDDSDRAEGLYRMRGKYEVKSRRLALKPEAWVREPPGYVMVGLRGTLARSGESLSGTVEGPGCSTFETKLDPATAGR
jgi:hypothetical protein